MKFLSLFSGIGGFDLGLERAGMECVGQVEIDPYCQAVLKKHWLAVKRMGDIKNVTGTEFGAVDLVCGGVPCQPASSAGKRGGTTDDRWLWPDAFRIVRAVKPAWCLFENVRGLTSLEQGVVFDNLLSELEGLGYEVQALIIPACAIGAPHRRDRVWIIANSHISRISQSGIQQTNLLTESNSDVTHTIESGTGCECGEVANERRGTSQDRGTRIRSENREIGTSRTASTDTNACNAKSDPNRIDPSEHERRKNNTGRFKQNAANPQHGRCEQRDQGIRAIPELDGGNSEDVADPAVERSGTFQTGREIAHGTTTERRGNPAWGEEWPSVAARLCRVDDGVSNRVHRLKALGNAVVPQIVEEIGRAIIAAEQLGGENLQPPTTVL
jgi:DNA (cytosine-5)-methyltransferase 1